MNITQKVNLTPEKLKILESKAKLPTNDVIFHLLFGSRGNENITKSFIQSIINKPVSDINLDLNPNLEKTYYDNKLGILDVRAKDSTGVNYNIEMQNISTKTLPERILSYWSRLFTGELNIGDTYEVLNKTIAILIVNDNIKNLTFLRKFHTRWNIREETYTEVILTDYFEIHIIELPKYKEMLNKFNKNIWLDFIIQPQGEEVLEAMKNNEDIRQAKTKWDQITKDRRLRDEALRLEIKRLDYNTGMKEARDEGIAQGNRNTKIEFVKRLLSMNFDIELIVQLTDLSKDEIEQIKSQKTAVKM